MSCPICAAKLVYGSQSHKYFGRFIVLSVNSFVLRKKSCTFAPTNVDRFVCLQPL